MSEEGQVTDEGGEGQVTDDGEGGDTILGGGDDDDKGGEGDSQVTDDKGGEGGEGDKGGEGDDQVPETYEFNMPEGMELDKALADAAQPVFKELELTQEQADKLTHLLVQQRAAENEASLDAFVQQLSDWTDELKNDEDFGGENFAKNSDLAFGFIDKTMPDKLKAELLGEEGLFEQTGVGQHPALVKYFFHLAKTFPVKEDEPGGGDAGGGESSIEDRMYPKEAAEGGN